MRKKSYHATPVSQVTARVVGQGVGGMSWVLIGEKVFIAGSQRAGQPASGTM